VITMHVVLLFVMEHAEDLIKKIRGDLLET
jgi:hypothetical protein